MVRYRPRGLHLVLDAFCVKRVEEGPKAEKAGVIDLEWPFLRLYQRVTWVTTAGRKRAEAKKKAAPCERISHEGENRAGLATESERGVSGDKKTRA